MLYIYIYISYIYIYYNTRTYMYMCLCVYIYIYIYIPIWKCSHQNHAKYVEVLKRLLGEGPKTYGQFSKAQSIRVTPPSAMDKTVVIQCAKYPVRDTIGRACGWGS